MIRRRQVPGLQDTRVFVRITLRGLCIVLGYARIIITNTLEDITLVLRGGLACEAIGSA